MAVKVEDTLTAIVVSFRMNIIGGCMHDDEQIVDTGIIESTLMFVALGLEPGNCTTHLILNDKDRALASMHPASKPYIDNTLAMVQRIVQGTNITSPSDFKDWRNQKGLVNANHLVLLQYKLIDSEIYDRLESIIKNIKVQHEQVTNLTGGIRFGFCRESHRCFQYSVDRIAVDAPRQSSTT
jgi:hypothetical protein